MVSGLVRARTQTRREPVHPLVAGNWVLAERNRKSTRDCGAGVSLHLPRAAKKLMGCDFLDAARALDVAMAAVTISLPSVLRLNNGDGICIHTAHIRALDCHRN
jgi:hypothetical protein